MSRLKNYFLAVCCVALLACTPASRADTIQLMTTTGGSTNGVEIYPYNFSVNGSSTLTSLACLNYDREITFGEKWNVSVHGLAMDNSTTSIDYRADAVLYYTFGKYGLSNSDVQFAIWSILDPAVTGNSGFTAVSQNLVNQAMYYATNSDLINSGFFGNFSLYTPTADRTGWTMGTPQEFIGAAAVTPEPSSLLLLGTGLLGTGFVIARRRFTEPALPAC